MEVLKVNNLKKYAKENNLQILAHCNGDAAAEEFIDICEKVGNKAYVRGTVSPSRRLTSSQDEYTITTIPEKYRPLTTVFSVFCGTGLAMFFLRVYADGNVTISRYGHQGSGYTAIPTNAFLAFEINYTVDSYN